MKKIISAILILIYLTNFIHARNRDVGKVDSLVKNAISQSEESLYEAKFDEARTIIKLSSYDSIKEFNIEHEILLTIQALRIEGYMNILYLLETDYNDNLERLIKLFPEALELEDNSIKGSYFYALSRAYSSVGIIDSAKLYEEKALQIFLAEEDFHKIAEIQAYNISSLHNQLLREGKKHEILNLIPKYEKEIEFSAKYSKFTLAYNLRHLAQIYRRQTSNYNESLRLFESSLFLREEIGFKPFIPASYSSLGDVYLKMENYDNAIEMYQRSAELAKEVGFVRYESYPLLMIGDIYFGIGNFDVAMDYYKKALDIATNNEYVMGINTAVEKIGLVEGRLEK